jgi:hypothetical protein
VERTSERHHPAPPGGLGIRQRRTWATWQLVAACTVACLVGMMVGYSGQKPSTASAAGKPIVALGGLDTTATTATTGAITAPSTTAPTAAAPAVLMANTPGRGPSDLPTFAAGGPWSIGWHFRCVNAPAGTGTFTLEVVSEAGATSPAVTQTSREAQGISPQSAPGHQHLKITTDPACQWAVKVTGIGP